MFLYRNKEWLENQYITLNKKQNQIAKELGCNRETIRKWIEKHNIKKKTRSEYLKGKKHSEEAKLKMSKNRKGKCTGKDNPWYGKHLSEEHKKKISDSHIGMKHTDETKQKLSILKKGINNHFFGKHLSLEHREKLSESNKGKHNHWRENNPNWKGGRRYSKGRVLIKNREHPFSHEDGYIFEHRLVIEAFLKDYIDPKNVVHHINGIKDDNRLSNLMLFKNQAEHSRFHDNLKGGIL